MSSIRVFLRNEYLLASSTVLVVTGLGLLLRSRLQPIDIAMLLLLAVVFAASRFGRGPSLFAGIATVAIFDFCFVPPYYTFSVLDQSYVLSFAVMFVIALLMSELTGRIREQAKEAGEQARQTNALYQMTRELSMAGSAEAELAIVTRHISKAALAEANLLLVSRLPGGSAAPIWPAEGALESMDMRMAATWAIEHGEPAGWSAVHGADAEALVVPLKSPTRVVGLAVIRPELTDRRLSESQLRTVEALAEQAAIALERRRLDVPSV